MRNRNWYLVNLKAWRGDLLEQLRREAARCARLEGSSFSDLPDMVLLCDLTRDFIKRLNEEIATIDAGDVGGNNGG